MPSHATSDIVPDGLQAGVAAERQKPSAVKEQRLHSISGKYIGAAVDANSQAPVPETSPGAANIPPLSTQSVMTLQLWISLG
jgi:hypothetical protein